LFALNRKFIEMLLADVKWSRRLEEAKTEEEVIKVLVEFARAKGLRVEFV